jgi:CHAT domain-containing protein
LDVFNFFTEAERENFWTLNARELLVLNNMVADKYPDMANIAFDNLLFVKNLKLMSSDILKDIVDSSSNAELRRKYKKYLSLREAISYQSTMRDSIMTWKNQLKEEERSILALIPNFKERLLSSFHSWDEIKKALKEDEIAIDFTYVPKMEDWDKYQGFYGAFVITNDSKIPHLVSLCEVDSINQYFANTNADAMQISKLYQESVPIYNKLWGKLEPYLKGKKTIYFSPAGQLNLLNHNALVMPNVELFGNTYNLVRLSSTDKILSEVAKSKVGKNYQSAVIYGGILYDLSVADMQEAAKFYSHYNDEYQSLLAMRSEDERGHWNYLPGTKAESQNVFRLLTSNNISSTLLQEKEANEESFKSLSGHSPQIIHLSTHGFFLDTTDKVKKNPFMNNIGSYSEKEDKLIRTGVLLAGANNVWC